MTLPTNLKVRFWSRRLLLSALLCFGLRIDVGYARRCFYLALEKKSDSKLRTSKKKLLVLLYIRCLMYYTDLALRSLKKGKWNSLAVKFVKFTLFERWPIWRTTNKDCIIFNIFIVVAVKVSVIIIGVFFPRFFSVRTTHVGSRRGYLFMRILQSIFKTPFAAEMQWWCRHELQGKWDITDELPRGGVVTWL